jgi:hypothetical protein
MMAPQYVRANLLCMAITEATSELSAPIDRIEIIGDAVRIDCWAGSRQVSIGFNRSEGGEIVNGTFVPFVGSVSWQPVVVQRPTAGQPHKRQWILAGVLIGLLAAAALSYAYFRIRIDATTGCYRSYAGVEICPPAPFKP